MASFDSRLEHFVYRSARSSPAAGAAAADESELPLAGADLDDLQA